LRSRSTALASPVNPIRARWVRCDEHTPDSSTSRDKYDSGHSCAGISHASSSVGEEPAVVRRANFLEVAVRSKSTAAVCSGILLILLCVECRPPAERSARHRERPDASEETPASTRVGRPQSSPGNSRDAGPDTPCRGRRVSARDYFRSPHLGALIAIYLVLNVAYTFSLKQQPILDVMCIASGFVLRAVAGSIVIATVPSPWIVLCTMTLAVFVGFGKRRHELLSLSVDATKHRDCLAGYSQQFLDLMMAVSAASAVVSYSLYTMADQTVARFGTHLLMATTPFVMYGIFRFFYLVHPPDR